MVSGLTSNTARDDCPTPGTRAWALQQMQLGVMTFQWAEHPCLVLLTSVCSGVVLPPAELSRYGPAPPDSCAPRALCIAEHCALGTRVESWVVPPKQACAVCVVSEVASWVSISRDGSNASPTMLERCTLVVCLTLATHEMGEGCFL